MAPKHPGPLTLDEISAGISACIDNIEALVGDADILLTAGRPARALTCLLVADQENGKVSILYCMPAFATNDDKSCRHSWRAFRNHRSKASAAVVGAFQPYLDETRLEGIIQWVYSSVGSAAENERQGTLYVDFDTGHRSWLTPLATSVDFVQNFQVQVRQGLARRLVERERGLYSVRVLEIRREVYSQVHTPTSLLDAIQWQTALNCQFTKRLAQEGYDVSPIDI
jgi:AbiV family abortive infection protein